MLRPGTAWCRGRQSVSAPAPPTGPERAYDVLAKYNANVTEYGYAIARWVMASLVAVNGGAQIAILTSADKAPAAAVGAGPWFVVGLVTAIAGGMATWLNCRAWIFTVEQRVDHALGRIVDPETSAARWAARGAAAFAWLSQALFLSSLIAFGYGAWRVSQALAASPG
jgi:hypothetical protein